MLKRFLLPVLLAAMAAFALAACGSSESDEDQVIEVIEASATTTDPADCEALATVAFNEQTAGGTGKEAVEACEEDAEDESGNPDEVEVTEVEIDGSTATALGSFTGGGFDGQQIELSLVEEDGDWKMDRLEGFVDFDQAALIGGLEEVLEEGDGIPADVTACIVEELEGLAAPEMESLVLDNEEEVFVELAESCQ